MQIYSALDILYCLPTGSLCWYHRYKTIDLLKVTDVEPLDNQQGEMGIPMLEGRRCDATHLPPYIGVSAKGF